jgi:hypothetical protein
MTNQQHADLLLAQWQLLWPLPAAERIERIEAIALDYVFEEQLALVSSAMSELELCDV